MPIQYVSETPLSKKCIQNSRKKQKSGSFFVDCGRHAVNPREKLHLVCIDLNIGFKELCTPQSDHLDPNGQTAIFV
jgi:hypothetical protein